MAFDFRKHGRLLAAEPEPKLICDRCGCQFVDDTGYGETTCLDCTRTQVAEDNKRRQDRLAVERGKLLARIHTVQVHIRDMWHRRHVDDLHPSFFRGAVTDLRALYTCLEICLALHSESDNVPSWGNGSSPYLKSPLSEGPGSGGLWGERKPNTP